MFNRKCRRCAREIKKDFDFCPYCGQDFRIDKRMRRDKDYGLLGNDDDLNSIMPNFNMPLPGFNKIFSSLLGEVDRQFRELDREMPKDSSGIRKLEKMPNASGISISISTANGNKPEIKVQAFGDKFKGLNENMQLKEAEIKKPIIDDEQAKKLSKLPKKEAETSVRRLSNKVVYEICLPGITSLKNVIINKLENSTEIKAFTEKNAYFKLLPIKLPLVNYKLKDDKLILEFAARN